MTRSLRHVLEVARVEDALAELRDAPAIDLRLPHALTIDSTPAPSCAQPPLVGGDVLGDPDDGTADYSTAARADAIGRGEIPSRGLAAALPAAAQGAGTLTGNPDSSNGTGPRFATSADDSQCDVLETALAVPTSSGVAQLVEHEALNLGVDGSTPFARSIDDEHSGLEHLFDVGGES